MRRRQLFGSVLISILGWLAFRLQLQNFVAHYSLRVELSSNLADFNPDVAA